MKVFIGIIVSILLTFILITSAYAQQGCCSHHSGVDYCDTSIGSYVCNDGTYSPTCGCYRVPVNDSPTPYPMEEQYFYQADPTNTPIPTPTLTFIQYSSNKITNFQVPVVSVIFLVIGASIASFWVGRDL